WTSVALGLSPLACLPFFRRAGGAECSLRPPASEALSPISCIVRIPSEPTRENERAREPLQRISRFRGPPAVSAWRRDCSGSLPSRAARVHGYAPARHRGKH